MTEELEFKEAWDYLKQMWPSRSKCEKAEIITAVVALILMFVIFGWVLIWAFA
jgi:hypothetical protein